MQTISELAYELYKLDWLTRISQEQRIKALKDYYRYVNASEGIDDSYSFEDYIFDFGYDGSIYVCFDKFIDGEYEDEEYIAELLCDEKLYSEYSADIAKAKTEEPKPYFNGLLPKYIMVIAQPNVKATLCKDLKQCVEMGLLETMRFGDKKEAIIKLWEKELEKHKDRWVWFFVDEICLFSGFLDSWNREEIEMKLESVN